MQIRTRLRITAAGGLLATLGALPTGPGNAAGTGLDHFYDQRPNWQHCAEPDLKALECATIQVPMDYQRPAGRKLSLALSRHRVADPAKRLGALAVDPMTSGGTHLPAFFLDRPIAKQYDLVGMVSRGDPPSTATFCARPGQQENSYASLPSRPTDAQLSRFADAERAHERSCARLGDGFRRYVTSTNIARDLDVVRAVLGERRLNYLGGSQATVVGVQYASLFPHRTGRVVLDSTLPPDLDWYRFQDVDLPAAHDRAIRRFAQWAGHRDATYHLGLGAAAVMRTVDATSRRLATKPVGVFTRSRYDNFAGRGTHSQASWSAHAHAHAHAHARALALAKLSRGVEPNVDTSILLPFPPANHYQGAIYSYTCETPWPRDLDGYYRRMRDARVHHPYGYGVALRGPGNCTFRSYPRPERPAKVTSRGLGGALVVQAQYDATTPHAYGVAMARRTGAALLTVRGSDEHAPYHGGTNGCVTKAVDAYLIHGIRPTVPTCRVEDQHQPG